MTAPGAAAAPPIISVENVSKTYATGFRALEQVDLAIRAGEIFALLGPNGAGKTTLIGMICGLVKLHEGRITVAGHDIERDYRAVRSLIGLVPQELTTDAFETVTATVEFSRGLFGKRRDPARIEQILRALSLWDKRDERIRNLSGGMKRRLMIAKALAHEPRVLFLNEPSAGVDVALRKEMWAMVRALRESGVTIFLTTHYIEEAEEMADRVGVISHGRLVLVEDKTTLMRKLGKKLIVLELQQRLEAIPPQLAGHDLVLDAAGANLTYVYDARSADSSVASLLDGLAAAGVRLRDLHTRQSSLKDIFVSLVAE